MPRQTSPDDEALIRNLVEPELLAVLANTPPGFFAPVASYLGRCGRHRVPSFDIEHPYGSAHPNAE
jgi:hypothetical protein